MAIVALQQMRLRTTAHLPDQACGFDRHVRCGGRVLNLRAIGKRATSAPSRCLREGYHSVVMKRNIWLTLPFLVLPLAAQLDPSYQVKSLRIQVLSTMLTS